MTATKFVILALVGSLASADPTKKDPTKILDLKALAGQVEALQEFVNDPDDVGKLGKGDGGGIPAKLELFDFEQWRKATGDPDSSLQKVSSRSEDLSQLVDYNKRYRKYGQDATEDRLDFDVVREGFGKGAALGFEGVLLLANSLEAQDADKDGRLTKAEFVTVLRGAPADVKEERVRKAAKLDKDPEALFELLRVDDAELLDIGAFVEGVSYAITPRGVAYTKTAQEESEALARGGVTKDQALDFVAARVDNAEKEQGKALQVLDEMQKNPHAKEFQQKVEDAGTELGRQAAGLQKSMEDGDLASFEADLGKGAGTAAARYAGAAASISGVPGADKVSGLGEDLQKEYEHYKKITDEVNEETRQAEKEAERRHEEDAKGKPKVNKFKVKVNDEVYEMEGNSRQFYRDVDEVMKVTGEDHKTAAQALAEAGGDAQEAIEDLRSGAPASQEDEEEQDKADRLELRQKRQEEKKKNIDLAKEKWQALKDRVSAAVSGIPAATTKEDKPEK